MGSPSNLESVKTFIARAKRTVKRADTRITPWVFFVCLAAGMLFSLGRDTLAVPAAAFAATATLAGLCFSYARTLKEGSAVRDEVVFAGERLVSGALLFLVALVLHYASHDIPTYTRSLIGALPKDQTKDVAPPLLLLPFSIHDVFGFFIDVLAFLIFLAALVDVRKGVSILSGVVAHRAKRRTGHDDYFGSAKDVEQRLIELEEADKRNGVVASPTARQTPDA